MCLIWWQTQFLTPPPWRTSKLLSRSRGKIFMTGRVYSPVIVFTFTTGMIPSDDGWTSIIRVRGHFPLNVFSSFNSTIVPVLMFAWSRFHLRLDCNAGRYSNSNLFQNWLDIAITCFHLVRHNISWSFSSITAPPLYLPIRRWFDVSGSRSSGLSLTLSERSVVDDCFDFCEYCHQLELCQNRVFLSC